MALILKENEIHRVRLKRWIELEEIKESIKEAVEIGSSDVIEHLLDYISTASGLDYSDDFWLDSVDALVRLQKLNAPKEFPIFRVTNKPNNVISFHYEGREWFFWVNLFASKYGWTIEYISELDVDHAVALLQEIVYDDTNDKEFMWILSDVAYSYDKKGKGTLKPFKKPDWMRSAARIAQPQKVRIRKDLLPVGNVINADEIKRIYSKSKEEGSGDSSEGTEP